MTPEEQSQYRDKYHKGKEYDVADYQQGIRDYTNYVAPRLGLTMAGSLVGAEALSALPFIPAAGNYLARGINFLGKAAMPSSLLKGMTYYTPEIAKTVSAISP